MDKAELRSEIQKLQNPKMLTVGDFAIDEMVYGDTERISREAPVLILRHSRTDIILGTASNAANNISKLNKGKSSAIGVYGDDYHAPILLKALEDAGINTEYMVQDKQRHTTTKTRISGACSQSVTQQIVRIDRQSTEPLSSQTEKRVIENLEKAIPLHDGVILSDYHLGFLTDNVISCAINIAKKYNKPVIADIQKDFLRYKGVCAITPNQPDTEKFVGYHIKDEASLMRAGREIVEKLELKYLLLTRGGEGMVLFGSDGTVEKIPAFNKKEVFDVTGAGDTVVGAFGLAYSAGVTPKNAAVIGNLAASIVIRHFGCHTTTTNELIQELEGLKE